MYQQNIQEQEHLWYLKVKKQLGVGLGIKKNKLFPQFSFLMILQVLVLKGDDTLFLELDMC